MNNYKLTNEDYKGIYPKEKVDISSKMVGGIDYLLFYSNYKYYLEKYLYNILKLDKLDMKISEIKKEIFKRSLYHKISSLNLNHVFIRNSLLISDLTNEEVEEFAKLIKQQNELEILKFIDKTYKKVIKFCSTGSFLAFYDPVSLNKPIENNSLVIGVEYKLPFPGFLIEENKKANAEVYHGIEAARKEYENLLGIPITIMYYNELFPYANDEYVEEKLEKIHEIEKEVYGKR